MDRRRPRRARNQRRANAAPAPIQPAPAPQAAPAQLPPYRLAGPVVNPRNPRTEEIYQATWALGNTNPLTGRDAVGRKFLPLPSGAPEIEATFFEFKNQYKTGQDLADMLMKAIYDDHLNRVGDKRREILQHLRRSSNSRLFARLDDELDVLMGTLNTKVADLCEATNMVVPIPLHFNNYPALV